ncbi:MAG: magnesium-translocating P-type ATPase [Chlamydiae bacterium]|nr:magnesium-translocating P-type ATPase [Chlamydiota bacterium]
MGDLFKILSSSPSGISQKLAKKRLKKEGLNQIITENQSSWVHNLFNNITNPFVLMLLALGALSWILGNTLGVIIIMVMCVMGVTIRFIQEFRSNHAAEKLKALVSTKATVLRGGQKLDLFFEELVLGDVVCLSAGDMIPADLRIFSAHDLFISQSALTGESRPFEKFSEPEAEERELLDLKNICFLGTNVVSGIGKGVVVATGPQTYFGSIAHAITLKRPLTGFDIGINKVSFLLIKVMLCMVPVVFLVNGFGKGNWFETLLFALSVAVGLTPEMLPMIVTTNLARGAISMSKEKVIVKQLSSIQNFGAMDILCTDKTGTLTEDKVVLEEYLDSEGHENKEILNFAYFNSYFQSDLKNLLDVAILEHEECREKALEFEKIDEIPFDFERKRMSVVIEGANQKKWLICKGSFESITSVCKEVSDASKQMYQDLSKKGLRVLGLCRKEICSKEKRVYHRADEIDLTFLGFLVFLDPPKASALEAIKNLEQSGIKIKVLTGDDPDVTEKVCEWVDLKIDAILTGHQLESMAKEEKREKILATTIFAKVSPMQKAEIIKELKLSGHTVGFMGDGINDAPALREADIGISVNTAIDIAKESSDIIMLEKSLLFLGHGLLEGRKTFANILKYIKMAVSSNFGNVLSVLGASFFLPFLPMLPIQILLQNLLYDISQVAIPFDHVDREYIARPRQWDSLSIKRFMLWMGPLSSFFDYTTFGILWFLFGANTIGMQALFQTGWFMEGLSSQVIAVHMIRTSKIPFIQSVSSKALLFSTAFIIMLGLVIPYTIIGRGVGMVKPSCSYFIFLIATVFSYCVAIQIFKFFYIRKNSSWL